MRGARMRWRRDESSGRSLAGGCRPRWFAARDREHFLDRQAVAIDDLPVLHHYRDLANVVHVGEGIGVEDDKIRDLAGLYRSELIELVVGRGDIARGRYDRVH